LIVAFARVAVCSADTQPAAVAIDRRTLLVAASAAAASGIARTMAQTPHLETLTDWIHASRETRAGALQPTIDRVAALDPALHAWVQVLPQRPTGDGPLAEIPFGAKDIIETRGLSTEYGSAIYKGRIGTVDAAIVRDLRARGAVLLGKTQTTAFAYGDPAPTVNPRSRAHTPGGSSSGSAAAVAAGMVPFALGTQTMGSVLRPASYCGVTGFKGTYGLHSLEGVLPFSSSLDTLGFFTHTPADMLALWEAMGHPAGRDEAIPLGVPAPLPEVEAPMTAAFQNAAAALRRGGLTIQHVDIAGLLLELHEAARTVQFYEGARLHEQLYREHGERLGRMGKLVGEGLTITTERYEDARRRLAEGRDRIDELYESTPVILVPAATGPAPRGLALTGDARMNSPWTALGTPAITVPMPVGSALPLGLQLTATRGQDARVIRAAVRVHGMLSTDSRA
jgi:Asp-tRNA(Asn)/Glu-tRNA(Gln) amidotransferase A subunit family amidase